MTLKHNQWFRCSKSVFPVRGDVLGIRPEVGRVQLAKLTYKACTEDAVAMASPQDKINSISPPEPDKK